MWVTAVRFREPPKQSGWRSVRAPGASRAMWVKDRCRRSSIASIRYLGFSYAAYDASKAADNTFTRSVAMEFAPNGIRANVIHIGMMDTPLARQGISAAGRDITETFNRYAKKIPLGRMGTAWDSANAAAFLASDESSYITGVEIPVDGGLVCCTA